jgi:hypothetical protein
VEGSFMRWASDNLRSLPRWAAALVAVIGGSVLVYMLVCLFLAIYLWFNPIVF